MISSVRCVQNFSFIGSLRNNNEHSNGLVFVHFRALHMQFTSQPRQFNSDRISILSCFRLNLFFLHKLEPQRGSIWFIRCPLTVGRWHVWCCWEELHEYERNGANSLAKNKKATNVEQVSDETFYKFDFIITQVGIEFECYFNKY